MKTYCYIILYIVISSTILAQVDSTRNFNEKEIHEFKEGYGTCYFLDNDSTVIIIRSCRNPGNVVKYSFYLAKYQNSDSTMHLIGEGKLDTDSSRFDLFQVYVGKILKNKFITTYKFKKNNFGIFDIIFKVIPGDCLFFNVGNYSGQLDNIMLYSMDSFKIGEMIYGK